MTASLQKTTSLTISALILLTSIIAGMGKMMILSFNTTHYHRFEPESGGGGGCPPPPFDPKNDPGGCPPPPFDCYIR